MGTKVQLKSYLPEFCTMRDLNEDADSSWSHHYGNSALGRQLYSNDQQAGQSNRYSGCDRENIKRTIIEQNATFRNQVYELHRVYNRQKELVDEFKKKGPYGYLQADTSLSNSYTSQIPSDGANKMRHTLHLPATSTSYNKVPVTMNNDMMSPLNILRGSSSQSGPILTGQGAILKDDDTHKRCSRRMIDLQLPADVYIDCEDAEKLEKDFFAESSSVNMLSVNSIQAAPENDVKLSLRTSENFNYRGDNWKSDSCMQNGVASRGFADLNEPIGSVSYNFLGRRTTLEENQGHQLPTRSSTGFPNLQSAFFSGRHDEEGTYPNLLHTIKEISQERQFFNDKAGQTKSTRTLFSPVSSKENFSILSAVPQPKLKQPLEIFSPNQNKKGIWYQQKQGHGIEISGRYAHCERTAPSMPSSLSVHPSRDYASTASSLFSSWTNPPNGCSYIPLAGHSCPSDKWQSTGDLKSYRILGTGSSSHQNGNFQVDYGSASQLHLFGNPNLNSRIKDVNLNQVLPIGTEDCHIAQNNTVMSDSKGKHDNSLGFLSWLKKPDGISSSHTELDFSRDYPKLKTQEMEKKRPMLDLQDSQSTLPVHKNESSDGLNSKRIFGFTIFDKTKQDPALLASHKPPVTSGTKCSEKDLEIKNHVGGLITSSLRNHINLNADPSSWGIPDEDEAVVVPSQVLAPSVAPVIDLEAPIGLLAEKPHEALAKEAAENILWMSSNRDSHLDDISSHPLPRGSFDTLHWFVEAVFSNATKVKESSDEVLDLFEQTVLELEETKPEEFLCRPWKGEDEKNDDDDRKNIADSLLFTKARRGQGRKRRQRRDFQTDILPGLVSLSRNEVTEDLQTISGMMKASGQSWQYGVARRNMGRNARNSRARGRGPRSSTVTVAEAWTSPPPPPPVPAGPPSANNIEIEVDGGSIVGWGRTTRRCRRQRCPPLTNVAASIT